MFIRLDAAEFIKFFVIRVRPVFEGGVYLKSNLFLANNIMATEHLNLKKKKTYFSACLKSRFLYRTQLHNYFILYEYYCNTYKMNNNLVL